MLGKQHQLLIVGIAAVVLLGGRIALGAWTFSEPAPDAEKQESMTVVARGGGDGASESLDLRITRGQMLLNSGLGSYDGMMLLWTGSVVPPTGGFGAGAAVIKVWKESQDPDLNAPLVTQNITFVGA
jgi:hypothetical protein